MVPNSSLISHRQTVRSWIARAGSNGAELERGHSTREKNSREQSRGSRIPGSRPQEKELKGGEPERVELKGVEPKRAELKGVELESAGFEIAELEGAELKQNARENPANHHIHCPPNYPHKHIKLHVQ